ncbi:hypothetical protein CLV96_0004 [Leptospira meyeri]|uniref:Endonuclease/exonuclease/phosphatase family protein n=1 Tax=Leptospira meyeri TaxID=29508 RepID=A0A4R8MP29_LEPME|nr:endonuclease/exonuclease/phosphatase family protein [Leptospira meyeri]EKJ88756.1 endonuclease/exonuclease/phosphatase family protein [Leptospira meyeri serovar Hardjo str. Went 5]TDY71049.1 hypothetical protein CLV96_0004 [Leptospira meyeri]
MEIIYWNINNRENPVKLINNDDFNSNAKIVAISEFWEQESLIKSSSKFTQFQYDLTSKRTGLYSSNFIGMQFQKSEQYFSKYVFKYQNESVFLYLLHLKSQFRSESEALSLNRHFVNLIITEINSQNYRFAIIMGDFNISSHDKIFSEHFNFNTTNYHNESLKTHKKFYNYNRLKFYSPIDSFNGDLSPGPPGTYYFRKGNQAQGWHIYDNILVSYPLAKHLDKKECKILSEIYNTKLLSNLNIPDRKYSDHLPVQIKLL